MALDFLESMRAPGRRQVELLRDVGDKSLLFCGLFPGIANRRHVSIEYYSDLGQAAYLTVGELQESLTGNLYLQLSEQFSNLQQILQAMRSDYLQTIDINSRILTATKLSLQ